MANLSNLNDAARKSKTSSADRNVDLDMQRWFSAFLGGGSQKTLKMTAGGADQLAEACSELRRVGSSLVMAESLGNSCLSGSLPAPASHSAQSSSHTWPLDPNLQNDDHTAVAARLVATMDGTDNRRNPDGSNVAGSSTMMGEGGKVCEASNNTNLRSVLTRIVKLAQESEVGIAATKLCRRHPFLPQFSNNNNSNHSNTTQRQSDRSARLDIAMQRSTMEPIDDETNLKPNATGFVPDHLIRCKYLLPTINKSSIITSSKQLAKNVNAGTQTSPSPSITSSLDNLSTLSAENALQPSAGSTSLDSSDSDLDLNLGADDQLVSSSTLNSTPVQKAERRKSLLLNSAAQTDSANSPIEASVSCFDELVAQIEQLRLDMQKALAPETTSLNKVGKISTNNDPQRSTQDLYAQVDKKRSSPPHRLASRSLNSPNSPDRRFISRFIKDNLTQQRRPSVASQQQPKSSPMTTTSTSSGSTTHSSPNRGAAASPNMGDSENSAMDFQVLKLNAAALAAIQSPKSSTDITKAAPEFQYNDPATYELQCSQHRLKTSPQLQSSNNRYHGKGSNKKFCDQSSSIVFEPGKRTTDLLNVENFLTKSFNEKNVKPIVRVDQEVTLELSSTEDNSDNDTKIASLNSSRPTKLTSLRELRNDWKPNGAKLQRSCSERVKQAQRPFLKFGGKYRQQQPKKELYTSTDHIYEGLDPNHVRMPNSEPPNFKRAELLTKFKSDRRIGRVYLSQNNVDDDRLVSDENNGIAPIKNKKQPACSSSESGSSDDYVCWERCDSGVGSSLSRSPSAPGKPRVRWHSFQRQHARHLQRRPANPMNSSGGSGSARTSSDVVPIDSLSVVQVMQVQKMAMIRVTSLMERFSAASTAASRSGWQFGVQRLFQRMKNSAGGDSFKNQDCSRVFGASLQTICRNTGQPLPQCILHAMRFLRKQAPEAVGLFRKSGVRSRIQAIRDRFEFCADELAEFESQQVYDIADAVKLYFRELPEPLLTFKLSETFIVIFQTVSESMRADTLRKVILLLPDENRLALQSLVYFLYDVASHVASNQMSAQNLAVCFAPSLFQLSAACTAMSPHRRRKTITGGLPSEKELDENRAAQNCLSTMIQLAPSLFTVANDILPSIGTSCLLATQEEPASLNELGLPYGNYVTYLNGCIDALLKEHRERWRGWLIEGCHEGVEMSSKKVNDGHPLKLWRLWTDVEAPPNELLLRLLRDRNVWDEDVVKWRTVRRISDTCDIFQYACNDMPPQPTRDFCVLRKWLVDMFEIRGGCVLVETSVEVPEAPSIGGLRGVCLASRYLIEPSGAGRSRVHHVIRMDIKGRSKAWYSKTFGHIWASRLAKVRDLFKQMPDGPETKV